MTTTLFVSATREEAAYLPAGTDLIVTGIGTLNCAIALTRELASRTQLPDRIINIGTAGGLRDGIGGVYEIARVFQHDFSSDLISQMLGRVLLQSWAESSEDSVSHSLMAAACGRSQAVSKTRLTITASGFGCP
ncbi:hypothetical protein [Corynebacterium lubricantis]|uniref:phosphorylase family protein n=1 Tax=Corynebacterium lubricantis TaxID=541095 RepID=UPI001FE026B5|nr:hypothetical protein [Corynebacterium lubricantis]